jgi:hypothetical protein
MSAYLTGKKWETLETFADAEGRRVCSRFRITGLNNGCMDSGCGCT